MYKPGHSAFFSIGTSSVAPRVLKLLSLEKNIWDPETNSKFAPENGWLEEDCFLFWMAFRAQTVRFRGVVHHLGN